MSGRNDLPGVIAEIADVAGIDVAWTIAQARGGQEVFIPAHAKSDHWLSKLVGFDVAQKICDHYRVNDNGTRLLIPMASAARRARLWETALNANLRVNDTAALVGVHRRTVFRQLRRIKKSDQGDLF